MAALFKVYRRNATTNAPELVLQDPTSVGGSLGNATLAEDLATLASKDFVNSAIADISLASLKGRVDDETALAAVENPANGDMYLVGAADAESFEEFIFFEESGEWERLGSVRASDVDLSAYSTTEEMTAAITAAQTAVQGNLDAAKTDLEGQIAALESSLEDSMAALDKDMIVTETLPSEWPADVADAGVVMVVSAAVVPAG